MEFMGFVSTNQKSLLILELLYRSFIIVFWTRSNLRCKYDEICELSDFCHRYFVEQVTASKTQGKKGYLLLLKQDHPVTLPLHTQRLKTMRALHRDCL